MSRISGPPLLLGHLPQNGLKRAPDSQPPPTRTFPQVDIVVKHPGYQEGRNELLLFRGFDESLEKEGLHHGTVLTACHIVSGRDGFLAEKKGGLSIELDFDDILPGGEYYYMVPDEERYKIIPSFRLWPFPNTLPSAWTKFKRTREATLTPAPASSNVAQAIIDRDRGCLLSRYVDAGERAHICPKEELPWFRENGMNKYNHNRLLRAEDMTEDMSNSFTMRPDIHRTFDKRVFVIVPKEGCWTVHFLEHTINLGSLYYNMRVNMPADIAVEHMFSRFAWAIFPMIRPFLEQGPVRSVRTQLVHGDDFRGAVKDLNGSAILETFFPRSRSVSPKKRKAGGNDDRKDSEEFTEMYQRGRKRRRSCSDDRSDIEIEEVQYSSGPWVGDHTRASSVQCRTTGTSSLPSPTHQTGAPEPVPLSSSTVSVDHGQSKPNVIDEDPRIQQLYGGEDKYDRLRREEVIRRRPHQSSGLYHCDYKKHQDAVWAAIKGEGPWDVDELCDECLGGEYLPLAGDLDD
ncbi:MAG: hypothetical protein Q9170_008211 [Blastenia crenularia]